MSRTITLAPLSPDEAEVEAAVRTMRAGPAIRGAEVAALEEELSTMVGGRPCVAVGSVGDAVHLALRASGIGAGDEVIVPSFAFGAVVHAIVHAGARPVFADITADTFTIDRSTTEPLVTSRTAAIIAVHLFGHPAALDGLAALATRHHLVLVEDATHAMGASVNGTAVGLFGQVAVFGLPAGPAAAQVRGALVVVRDPQVAQRLRLLRNHGMNRQYEYETAGYDATMDDVAAAIGRVQLRTLRWRVTRRQAHAAYLSDNISGAYPPPAAPGVVHVYDQYVVRSWDRAALEQRLAAAGIQTQSGYPSPVHCSAAYAQHLDLPVTERAAAEVLSLPVHTGLTQAELARIVAEVNRASDTPPG